MSASGKEEDDGGEDGEGIDDNVPVHGRGRDGDCLREEAEDEDDDEVPDGEVVNWTAPFAEAPEVVLLSLTINLVWHLQMARHKKFIVVLGFAFRLPLVGLAIMHAHYLALAIGSSNESFDGIYSSVFEEFQLGWSLIAATIPCLKSFVADLGTGFLGGSALEKNLDTFVMETISVSQRARSKVTTGRDDAQSNRSLTRTSNEPADDPGIRMTKDYHIGYEAR